MGQIQRGFHQSAQLVQRNRLAQIIKGARFERGHGIFHIAVRGDHCHRHIQIMLRNMPHHLQTIAVGQPHVGQAQVITPRRELCQRLTHIAGLIHFQPHLAQCQFQQLQYVRLIIHQQHYGAFRQIAIRHVHAPRLLYAYPRMLYGNRRPFARECNQRLWIHRAPLAETVRR